MQAPNFGELFGQGLRAIRHGDTSAIAFLLVAVAILAWLVFKR